MSFLYHIGLTPPPKSIFIQDFTISYYPVLSVQHTHCNAPQDLVDILYRDPVILMMSKNAVIGLEKWLHHYNLDSTYFQNYTFWTIGDRTHAYLQETLNIDSIYPEDMTGNGMIEKLHVEKISRILLIAGQEPRKEFIESLLKANISFFHFPVYEIQIIENTNFCANFFNTSSNYIIITSPSSVRGVLHSLSIRDLSSLKTKIISIGPTTSAAILDQGGVVFYESTAQNIKTLYSNLENIL